MANVIITTQPAAATAVPGQNTTFSVVASSDFTPVTYQYQWKKGGSDITGATSSSYTIDPTSANNGNQFAVTVSALSSGSVVATVNSNNATLTVTAEATPFDKFAVYPETGKERFLRLHHLGYV